MSMTYVHKLAPKRERPLKSVDQNEICGQPRPHNATREKPTPPGLFNCPP